MSAMRAIIWRELLRFLHQRERFVAALVRPLVWLLIFGAGFRAALGLAIYPPYDTYIRYETYIVPGLCGIIVLFNGMHQAKNQHCPTSIRLPIKPAFVGA